VTAANFAPVPVDFDLSLTAPNKSVVEVQNVSPPGVPNANGFTASGTLSPSTAPEIESITPGGLFGYIPLSTFGTPELADFEDETLVNVGVPAYQFGGEVYDTIAVTSNGYAKVGEGTSADLDFVPQEFPDPTSPNNVLAPLWTDLNPADGGTVKLDFLTDGVDFWMVIEWENVPTFGTGGAETQSFQIWIQLTLTPGELVTYEFDNVTGPGDLAVGTTTGAENRDGSSGVNLGFFPNDFDQYTINAGEPTAGGTVTVTYDAFGKKQGRATLVAGLETDITPGVTTEPVTISVT
jgi:hypothetical protein